MSRRQFLKKTSLMALPLGFPMVAKAASKNIQWKMVTTWPKNFPGLGTGANKLAKYITDASGGRLKVRVYGAGEMVPALGVFDAVSRGTAQMGHSAAYYWQGKHQATSFFGAVPFGLNTIEMSAWIEQGGGQKLWDEVYKPFGVQAFCAGNTGIQMGGWFNKKINKPEDFKGLKMRMPGLGGQVLSKMGSAVVTLSGGEIFQAMKLKTIDACEWVGPYNDLAFGLHKTAKFYYWPGWHEPGSNIEALINKKAYEALPKDLQTVVRMACQATLHDMYAEATARNATALVTLVKKHGVQVKRFPDAVLKKLGETSAVVVSDIAKKDPLTQKVYNSYMKFKKSSIGWNKISEEGYSVARSLTVK